MPYITLKSKETTLSVDINPPLVLGNKPYNAPHISLVDIKIPEQYFTFTDDQDIGEDPRVGKQRKRVKFSTYLGKKDCSKFSRVNRRVMYFVSKLK